MANDPKYFLAHSNVKKHERSFLFSLDECAGVGPKIGELVPESVLPSGELEEGEEMRIIAVFEGQAADFLRKMNLLEEVCGGDCGISFPLEKFMEACINIGISLKV